MKSKINFWNQQSINLISKKNQNLFKLMKLKVFEKKNYYRKRLLWLIKIKTNKIKKVYIYIYNLTDR